MTAPGPLSARVQSLRVYPIKGCAGTEVDRVVVTARGPAHDREFVAIRPDGRFLSQRQQPRLALIRPSLDALDHGELRLTRPYAEPLSVPIRTAESARDVTVWSWDGHGVDQGDDVANWLSAFLGQSVRLARFPEDEHRPTGIGGGELSYADGYPLLVASTASLADLNARMRRPVPMDRFRPNIVIDGWASAWTEDGVETMWLGDDVSIELVKPCARCVVTTVDQKTGERGGQEPLRTLASFRNLNGGLIFGQNAVPRTLGAIQVGDPARVTKWRSRPADRAIPA